jgi:hypothetical protein
MSMNTTTYSVNTRKKHFNIMIIRFFYARDDITRSVSSKHMRTLVWKSASRTSENNHQFFFSFTLPFDSLMVPGIIFLSFFFFLLSTKIGDTTVFIYCEQKKLVYRHLARFAN